MVVGAGGRPMAVAKNSPDQTIVAAKDEGCNPLKLVKLVYQRGKPN